MNRGRCKASPKADDTRTSDPCAAQPCLVMHMHFGCPLGPRWQGQHCLAARCHWGSQPRSSPAVGGGSRRAHPAAAFTRSLFYIKEPQHRSKHSEVSLAQPVVLSEGDALLSAAPSRGDGVIPTPSQPPPSHRSSRRQAGRLLAGSVDPQHRSAPSSCTGCPPRCLGLQRSPAPC